MTLFSKPKRAADAQAFTLLELLVVLAILAVIATGIAGVYGRQNIDEAKDKMTLHEMREIKNAFLRFESDNYRRLYEEFVDHNGATLPSSAFESTFTAGHIDDERLERQMEFYETYGLWFLMLPKVSAVVENTSDSDETDEFPVFTEYSALASDGWNGPYLDATAREAWNYGGIDFPQVADKHGGLADNNGNALGVYRLLYYEHCEDLTDDTEPIYRRLLLVSTRGSSLTGDDLLLETGNLRGGSDAGRLNQSTRTFSNTDDSPFFILELKNMDILP